MLYHIPVPLIRAVISVESDYDPRVVSRAGAMGLMQMMPSVTKGMGVTSPFDPRQNIFGGVRYLRVLANLFNGNLELTIAAYNAGEGAIIHYGACDDTPLEPGHLFLIDSGAHIAGGTTDDTRTVAVGTAVAHAAGGPTGPRSLADRSSAGNDREPGC